MANFDNDVTINIKEFNEIAEDERITVEWESSIEITPDEFLDECSGSEIDEVILWLDDNGYMEHYTKLEGTFDGGKWQDSVVKLLDNKHQLSVEDEEVILRIISKLV